MVINTREIGSMESKRELAFSNTQMETNTADNLIWMNSMEKELIR